MPLLPSGSTSYAQSLLSSRPNHVSSSITSTRSALSLMDHPEGGYFVETDRAELKVPNPFKGSPVYPNASAKPPNSTGDVDESTERCASTTIHYYLDPQSPVGIFHRNKGRTVHTLHSGRAIYIVIHADRATSGKNGGKAPVEVFTVGHDLVHDEKIQWVVEGGKFKSTYLLPDHGKDESETGMLISETVVPGFEFSDHDFLTEDGLRDLVSTEDFNELKWLLKRD